MDVIKLIALDAEDLAIVSAHVQDAVTRPGLARWLAGERRFVLPLNRFAWEKALRVGDKADERRAAVLHFDRVSRVVSTGIRPDDDKTVAVLLAVTFTATDEPAGVVTLHFAGGGRIRLEVECIEARLADLGEAWAARARPEHEASD